MTVISYPVVCVCMNPQIFPLLSGSTIYEYAHTLVREPKLVAVLLHVFEFLRLGNMTNKICPYSLRRNYQKEFFVKMEHEVKTLYITNVQQYRDCGSRYSFSYHIYSYSKMQLHILHLKTGFRLYFCPSCTYKTLLIE